MLPLYPWIIKHLVVLKAMANAGIGELISKADDRYGIGLDIPDQHIIYYSKSTKRFMILW